MNTIDNIKLTEQGAALLADLYEDEVYKVLVDVLLQRQSYHAEFSLANSTSMDDVQRYRGRAQEARWIYDFIKQVHQQEKKKEIAKNKEQALKT